MNVTTTTTIQNLADSFAVDVRKAQDDLNWAIENERGITYDAVKSVLDNLWAAIDQVGGRMVDDAGFVDMVVLSVNRTRRAEAANR